LKAAIQAFATKGDFPAEVLQVLQKFNVGTDYDLGYESLFDIRDFTGTNQSGFEILDVENGLTFAKVKVGEHIKVFKMGGSKSTVSFDLYGGALGWSRTIFDDQQYWIAEDIAIAFRNKAYSSRAQAFYTLLDAVSSSQNLAWQVVTPSGVANTDKDYIAIRDANTIEKACETILLACKDKGYGVTAKSQFIYFCPIQLKGRINRAIDFSLSSFVRAGIVRIGVSLDTEAVSLLDHLRIASQWDLDKKEGGLFILPGKYLGTLDALFKNTTFLRRANEELAIIAWGDCVYNIDFHELLHYHIDKAADITFIGDPEDPYIFVIKQISSPGNTLCLQRP